MKTIEISTDSNYVEVSFQCPNCKKTVNGTIAIPSPDFLAEKDTHAATRTDDYSDIVCPSCNNSFTIQATNSCIGGFLYFHDLDENWNVHIQ